VQLACEPLPLEFLCGRPRGRRHRG
jgi:hypothetical protein